jgi:hypothetical protein
VISFPDMQAIGYWTAVLARSATRSFGEFRHEATMVQPCRSFAWTQRTVVRP